MFGMFMDLRRIISESFDTELERVRCVNAKSIQSNKRNHTHTDTRTFRIDAESACLNFCMTHGTRDMRHRKLYNHGGRIQRMYLSKTAISTNRYLREVFYCVDSEPRVFYFSYTLTHTFSSYNR